MSFEPGSPQELQAVGGSEPARHSSSDGLHPDQPAKGSRRVDRELPAEARSWERIVDTTSLLPGDLILTRDISPDRISRAIFDAQEKGGFHRRHAQWTHAAVYLGDGEHICEANFKVPNLRWGVTIRSIYSYCDGHTVLRARRPRVHDEKQRIRIAMGALLNMGKGYSFRQIWTFGRAAASGKGFWHSGATRQKIRSRALVCSTLYQDAYNFSFQGMTARMGTMCTPAHLSASADFEDDDPELCWLTIE